MEMTIGLNLKKDEELARPEGRQGYVLGAIVSHNNSVHLKPYNVISFENRVPVNVINLR